jgi:quinoprotein glucose dehydrogenase
MQWRTEMIMRRRILLAAGAACAAMLAWTTGIQSQTGTGRTGEWRDYAGDKGFTKYSPLDQINASNVANLRIAWRRSAVADELKAAQPDLRYGNSFRSTPLMIDGVLYAQNGIGLVEAFDPETGKTIWVQERFEGDQLRGQPSRGIAQWGTDADARLLTVRGQYLVALEPKTGKIIRSFGSNGRVDLLPAIGPKATGFAMTSSPQVCNDVVIIGNAMSDSPNRKDSLAPGIVQAIDVRTGRVRWTFNPIPRPGEVGSETWEEDSWSYSGAANVWSLVSSDEQLGLAYLPTGAPTNDMYGGHRPGDNLFSNSLVCVRCATGERVWHYQLVHHDLWDYDTNVAPILVDIPVGGKVVRAVVQLTKQAMAYVFDRATGRPIWPIEERPVPTSKTPGEKTARTQPFPTKPAPFDRHGLTTDDLIDFTPELRAEALEIAKRYVLGPIYTPPSVRGPGPNDTKGTLQMPGATGGAEWGGAGFDPETGIIYIPSITGTFAADLLPGDPKSTDLRYTRGDRELVIGPRGLPITKPPYGRIVAIDLKSGDHLWSVANGDGPRDHEAIRHLNLPPLGQPTRDMPLLTRTLLFVSQGDPIMIRTPPGGGTNGNRVRAYDKKTGAVVWDFKLPAGTTGAIMTYLHKGKQYIVAPIGATNHPAEFVALSLP